MAEYFGMSTWQVPFPSWKQQAMQVAIFFVFEDMFHFFAHRALHWGPLYKHIHKIHHKYSAPFGLAAEYAHPAEVMILGTGTIAGPILYCAFRRDLHIVTVYIWIILRLFQAVDAHSGYGEYLPRIPLPFSLSSILSLSLHVRPPVLCSHTRLLPAQTSPGRSSTGFPSGLAPSTTTSTTWRS